MPSVHDPISEVLDQLGSPCLEGDSPWAAMAVSETLGGRVGHLRCERYWEGSGLFASAHGVLFAGDIRSGHLKSALTARASQSLDHEIRVLTSLNGSCGGFETPRVLAHGCTSSGRTWCLMEHVGTRKAVLALSRINSLVWSIASTALPAPLFPVPAEFALAALEADEAGVSVHGDLIRSNVLSGGPSRFPWRPKVIDWEWATGDGMRGFDVCHLVLGGLLTGGPPPDRKLGARLSLAGTMLRRIGLKDVSHRLLAYLAGMSEFYRWCAIEEGQDPSSESVVVNAQRIRELLAGGTGV